MCSSEGWVQERRPRRSASSSRAPARSSRCGRISRRRSHGWSRRGSRTCRARSGSVTKVQSRGSPAITASARSCKRASSWSMRAMPVTPRCWRSRPRCSIGCSSRRISISATSRPRGSCSTPRPIQRRAMRWSRRSRARIAREFASRHARCRRRSPPLAIELVHLWGPRRRDDRTRARVAVARFGARSVQPDRAHARGARRARSTARAHDRSRRSARVRLLHRDAVRARSRPAHPKRSCAAVATTS